MSTKPRISRRDFIATTAIGLLALPAVAREAAAGRFSWGVASYDPTATSVGLWSRIDPAAAAADPVVKWEVALQPQGPILHTGTALATADRDFTLSVICDRLKPGTSYWYRFVHASGTSMWGQTRTLPASADGDFKIAVVSCSNFPAGYFHAYRSIAERDDIDLVVHVGDYIYEYGLTGFGTAGAAELGRTPDPPNDIVSLADYRRRYAQYRSDPDLQALHARHPVVAIWDDHEVANDTWREGAQNHKASQGSFQDRLSAARRAYFEWLPTSKASADVSGVYRALEIGELATLVLVDTRLDGRDRQISRTSLLANPESNIADWQRADRRIMSDQQERWIADTLNGSKAAWQLVAMQNPALGLRLPTQLPNYLDQNRALTDTTFRNILPELIALSQKSMPFSFDSWSGYPAARERFLASIAANARNPIFLCGDIHTACAATVRNSQGRAIAAEFVSPAVTSPSFYRILPITDADGLGNSIRAANPGLDYIDGRYNGWLEIELTARACAATFWAVSPVTDRTYAVNTAARYTVDRAGKLSAGPVSA